MLIRKHIMGKVMAVLIRGRVLISDYRKLINR
jgi:hypothetical protein